MFRTQRRKERKVFMLRLITVLDVNESLMLTLSATVLQLFFFASLRAKIFTALKSAFIRAYPRPLEKEPL